MHMASHATSNTNTITHLPKHCGVKIFGIKMQFVKSLDMFIEKNLPEHILNWLNKRKASLENGFTIIEGNLNFLMVDEPFFLIFDVFHIKNVNNAPNNLMKWKILAIAVSNFQGSLQIVYLRTAPSGTKMGSEAILEGVKMVISSIRKSPELTTKLAGAVANKFAANWESIKYLQMNGVPVLYDLKHFRKTITRLGHLDVFITSLHTIPTFTKQNFLKIILGIQRLVEKHVPSELYDRYNMELLSLQALFGNLFNKFPLRKFNLGWLNCNHLEDVGAMLANDVHVGAEDGFKKYPAALADPKEAVAFMATLTTVLTQKINEDLKEWRIALVESMLLVQEEEVNEDEAAVPAKRSKLN